MQGFKRLSDNLTDLELDVPSARQDFECLKETAEMQGWLPDAGENRIPRLLAIDDFIIS